MPVSAILVIDNRSILNPASDEVAPGEGEHVPPRHSASLEILGQTVVERTITRLRVAGVRMVSVVDEAAISSTAGLRFIPDALTRQAEKGFDKVLLIRVGAYAEVDVVESRGSRRRVGTRERLVPQRSRVGSRLGRALADC